VGKTRLAIEVARRQATAAGRDVAFVALAPLSDAALLPGAISTTLGIREKASPEPDARSKALHEWLRAHPLLLVLSSLNKKPRAAPSSGIQMMGRSAVGCHIHHSLDVK